MGWEGAENPFHGPPTAIQTTETTIKKVPLFYQFFQEGFTNLIKLTLPKFSGIDSVLMLQYMVSSNMDGESIFYIGQRKRGWPKNIFIMFYQPTNHT